MLGTGLFFGMLAVALGKEAKANHDIKKLTSEYDKNGNLHYIDNECREYINGERVKKITTEDANGLPLYSTVGVTSSKVYETSYGRGTERLLEYSEDNKQRSIKNGKLAYGQFNPYFGTTVLTEISTNRTITCLFTWQPPRSNDVYRKWYFRPDCQGKSDYNRTVKGDYGIEITKEEYEKLNVVGCLVSHMPSDDDVFHDLMKGKRG